MRHPKVHGRTPPMAFIMLIALACFTFLSCEKEALTESRPTDTTGFNMERAVLELIYGQITAQHEADIQTQYQSLVNGLTADQLQLLQQAAEQTYRNNLELARGLQTRSPGASLSPGDLNPSFGIDVARSGSSVVVGSEGTVYFFEQGNLVADFSSDNPLAYRFGNEVAISGTRAVAMGALRDSDGQFHGGEVRTYKKQGGSWQLEDVIVIDDMRFGPEDIAMDGNRFVVTGRSSGNALDMTVKIYRAQGNNGWQLEQTIGYPAMHVWDTDIKANTIAMNGILNSNFLAPTVYILEYAGGSWTMTSQVALTAGAIHRNVAIGDDSYIVANVGLSAVLGSPAVVYEITNSDGNWAITGQLPAPGTSVDRALAVQGHRVAVAGGISGRSVYTFDDGIPGDTYGPGSLSYGLSLYVHGNEIGIGEPGFPEGVVHLEH